MLDNVTVIPQVNEISLKGGLEGWLLGSNILWLGIRQSMLRP